MLRGEGVAAGMRVAVFAALFFIFLCLFHVSSPKR